MITLANGTGSGVFSAPEPLPRADDRASGMHVRAGPRELHHGLALAVEAHRSDQVQEASGFLAFAAARAYEELAASEQARQRQAELLAVVAHELRNPLTPIRTAASLLGRIAPGDEGALARLQSIIERQVVHLSRLIDDLLDLSRACTGKLHLELAVVDLRTIVEQVVEARRPAARLCGIGLVSVLPAVPLEVDGDPVRLAQVLGNLLDNACKFTPDGGAIELLAAASGDLAVVSVSDSGIGIAPETLPHVFEPFAQGVQSPGVANGGLGLGLAVVSELVEAHGGCVVAHSAGTGRGSRFEVTLPRAGCGTARAAAAGRKGRTVS